MGLEIGRAMGAETHCLTRWTQRRQERLQEGRRDVLRDGRQDLPHEVDVERRRTKAVESGLKREAEMRCLKGVPPAARWPPRVFS